MDLSLFLQFNWVGRMLKTYARFLEVIIMTKCASFDVLFFRRRKKFCFPGRPRISNKDSPYAEIENQKGGASTYQELTI